MQIVRTENLIVNAPWNEKSRFVLIGLAKQKADEYLLYQSDQTGEVYAFSVEWGYVKKFTKMCKALEIYYADCIKVNPEPSKAWFLASACSLSGDEFMKVLKARGMSIEGLKITNFIGGGRMFQVNLQWELLSTLADLRLPDYSLNVDWLDQEVASWKSLRDASLFDWYVSKNHSKEDALIDAFEEWTIISSSNEQLKRFAESSDNGAIAEFNRNSVREIEANERYLLHQRDRDVNER